MDYEVTLAGKPMGRAQAEKQGLYYHVVCRCRLSGDVMYRLECSAGEKKTNLGILVPMDAGFGLDTRFPVSRVGEGELRFILLPRHDEMKERTFVPIRPEEPFRYMEQLKDAFLETREGQKVRFSRPSGRKKPPRRNANRKPNSRKLPRNPP